MMADDQYDPTPSDDELEAHLQTRNMVVNLGPSHPATHGTVRLRIELDGETIVKMDPEVGFLHRGFQKSCENVTWTQCLPYTDRLDYVAALTNNFGFLSAVEALIFGGQWIAMNSVASSRTVGELFVMRAFPTAPVFFTLSRICRAWSLAASRSMTPQKPRLRRWVFFPILN